MRVIVSTTGTSVAGGPIKDLSEKDYRQKISERIKEKKEDEKIFLEKISAETHSLVKLKVKEDDIIYLLHSDTNDGRICAEELRKIISDKFPVSEKNIFLEKIEDLQVFDAEKFERRAVKNLFSVLMNVEQKRKDYEMILNATGGFKSLVPYITLYGIINKKKVVYIFEHSDTLIELPQVPLSFDMELIYKARKAIRKIGKEGMILEREFFELIPDLDYNDRKFYESLIYRISEGGKVYVGFSAFGDILSRKLSEEKIRNIFIEKSLYEKYKKFNASKKKKFETILSKFYEPLLYKKSIHTWESTDLLYFKNPNTKERVEFYRKGNAVYITREWIESHDKYEREAGKKQIKDFKNKDYEEWENIFTEDEKDELYDEIKEELDKEKEKREQFEKKIKELTQKIDELKDSNKLLETKVGVYEEEIRKFNKLPFYKKLFAKLEVYDR